MKKFIVLVLCVVIYFSSSAVITKEKLNTNEKVMFLLPRNNMIFIVAGIGACMIIGSSSWKDPIGVQVGVEAKFLEFNENFSANAGLGVSFQGSAYEEDEFSGNVALTYLNVPLIVNYESNNGFYGEIGLQPGILLRAKDKYDGDSYDFKEYVKNFELGLPIGAGYHVNEQFRVGIRATIGMTNLNNYDNDTKDRNFMVVGVVRYTLNLAD